MKTYTVSPDNRAALEPNNSVGSCGMKKHAASPQRATCRLISCPTMRPDVFQGSDKNFIWVKIKQPALTDLFSPRAIFFMLFGKVLTLKTAVELFQLVDKSPDLIIIQSCILKLTLEFFRYTIEFDDGTSISHSVNIDGGSRKKKTHLGRKPKRRKPQSVPDNENNDTTADDKVNDAGERHRQAQRNYAKSSKGKESHKKYKVSDKGKEVLQQYFASDKGKEAQKQYSASDKGKETQKQYFASDKGKEALKQYSASDKGKETQKQYFASDKGKEAQKQYFASDKGKEARKQYSASDKGKETQKQYFASDKGKEARKQYSASDKGKETQKQYFASDKGKEALKKYSASDKGKEAQKQYLGSEKGKAARRAYRKSKNGQARRKAWDKLFRSRNKACMAAAARKQRQRKDEQVFIDFSSQPVFGDTVNLKKHEPCSDVLATFTGNRTVKSGSIAIEKVRDEILKGRKFLTPSAYLTAGTFNRNGLFKFRLRVYLRAAVEHFKLNDASFESAGCSETFLKKRKSRDAAYTVAVKKLCEEVFIKREHCVTMLKYQANRLKSFAEGVLATVSLQEEEKASKRALIGYHCHVRSTEPYLKRPSYVDGNAYDFDAAANSSDKKDCQKQDGQKENVQEEQKKSKTTVYKCTKNCILSSDSDIARFKELLTELSNLEPTGLRKFLIKYGWCSKYHQYENSTSKDLDPKRCYMHCVEKRYHPEECYIPGPNETDEDEFETCTSPEVLIKKMKVHYENARKLSEILERAMKAHKVLCDLDASVLLRDIKYLAKVVKTKVWNVSNVGFDCTSDARMITESTIIELLSKRPPRSKKKKETYGTIFDSKRSDLRSIKCHSCGILVAPSKVSKINVYSWKALKCDSETNLCLNEMYQEFHDFMSANALFDHETDDDDDENDHPLKRLHGLDLCHSCKIQLDKSSVPPAALYNNMYTGKCPEVLKLLNPIETMLVSKVKCFQTIIKPGAVSKKMPRSERISAMKGNFICLPLGLRASLDQLYNPKSLFDPDIVEDLVYCYGRPKKDKSVWRHLVDRKKVFDALKWLIANNRHYSDLTLPERPEDILPDVFGNDDDAANENMCRWCQGTFEQLNKHESECQNRVQDGDTCQQEAQPADEPAEKQADKHDNEPAFDSDIDNSSHSGSDSDAEVSNNDIPWLRRMDKEELDQKYGKLTIMDVDPDSKAADEIFRQLDITSDPIRNNADGVDCLAFPTRFPTGEGSFSANRRKHITAAEYAKRHIYSADPYARCNKEYMFYLAELREKRTIDEGMFSVMNAKKQSEKITKKDLATGAKEADPNLLKKVARILAKLPSQKNYWIRVRNELKQMIHEYGPPTFWATFSPGDYNDDELHDYLVEMSGLPSTSSMTTSELVARDPALACEYLQKKFDALLEFILSDAAPLGLAKHHFVRTEYQTRLMPHFHCLFWIEGAPIIGVDDAETIMKFIGQHITCKIPDKNEDPLLHDIVMRYQKHKCNSYCLRNPKSFKGKARCKFSYPRKATHNPILYSVESSIASHKSGSYKRRLYEIERKKSEEWINDYNPILSYMWKGNIDIQFIGEHSASLVEYISKYATKAPKSQFDEFKTDMFVNDDSSERSKLYKLSMRAMKSREMGAMEARNLIMAEPAIKTDARFQFINAVLPCKRKRMLKSKAALKNVRDDSKEIYNGDYVHVWYPCRPVSVHGLSLYEYAKTYERISNSDAANFKDKSRLLKLQGDHGYMKKREITKTNPNPVIVYGPSHLDPFSKEHRDEFFYSCLMLHKPWLQECNLKGDSPTCEAEYNRLKNTNAALAAYVEDYFNRKKLKDTMAAGVDAEMPGQEKTDKNDESNDTELDGDHGSDHFHTVRKQSTIETEEQLQEAVNGLSEDQRKVYDLFVENADHYYSHKKQLCSCSDFKPALLYVSGFGGSGKSHLIKVLMAYQYVRSEVKKEPCHFLLGAPTGMASCNINGQTLHQMWSLPVEHGYGSWSYKPLKPGPLNRMKANYMYACGHIIDEVSMISNVILMNINKRMQDVTGCHDVFGGLPMVFFGDLLQLEPVNDGPPYVALSSKQARGFCEGMPSCPDIWKLLQFYELKTNHRQKGGSNAMWRDILANLRYGNMSHEHIDLLKKRVIDTAGCILKSEYLERYIDKFIECEDKGLKPVCLLPKRNMCNDFNTAIMARKSLTGIPVRAQDKIMCPKKRQQAVKKKLAETDDRETGGLESMLYVAVGSRVMMRVNDKNVNGLVNGARGTVQEIIKSGRKVSEIKVKFDDIEAVQSIQRIDRKFMVFPGCYVYRSMFPLISSYAMTIHKSQSLSLPCVFADVGSEIFAPGMTYVALSRCTSYDGLHLMNFDPKKAVASRKACVEYERLMNTNLQFNRTNSAETKQNVWYTSFGERKAKNVTTDNVKRERKRRKPSSANENKHNKKRKTKPADPTPADSTAADVDLAFTNMITAPVTTFNYCPTDRAWQEMICSAFNWRFVSESRPGRVDDVFNVPATVRPIPKRIRGDGFCWYRTISHVATGNEQNYPEVMNSLQNFMTVNRVAIKSRLEEKWATSVLHIDVQFLSSRQVDIDAIIAHHFGDRRRRHWADNVIMAITMYLLKTKFYLFKYDLGPQWYDWAVYYDLFRDENPENEFSRQLVYPVDFPRTTYQFMYIDHNHRGTHFEPSHTGLQI